MSHDLKKLSETEIAELAKAEKILNNGWRQGSILDPRSILSDITLSEGELLIVCTHSCTVVSRRFSIDPNVETMVVKPLVEHNSKSPEATGKNQRKLHIELTDHLKFKCIECDFHRRYFFDRSKLIEIKPLQEFSIETKGIDKLAGWIGRAYMRITLPDQLIEQMRLDLLKKIEKCLRKANSENLNNPLHESVPYIYLDWQPRNTFSKIFELRFMFLCSDPKTEEILDKELLEKLKFYLEGTGKDGIKISRLICRTRESTFINELDGYERFSDWDYLSNLEDFAHVPPS